MSLTLVCAWRLARHTSPLKGGGRPGHVGCFRLGPMFALPKSATADFGWRSGGGRDPHPIPPLFEGREEIAALSESNAVALPRGPSS